MYICIECGLLFDDEEMGYDRATMDYPGATFCPSCKGDYVEARNCDNCGAYMREDEGEFICDECKAEAYERLRDAFLGLTPAQVEHIDHLCDGEYLAKVFNYTEEAFKEHVNKEEPKK